ncbi:MAG TPA: hypothetical protein VFG50_06220 [Rhodothermales bacterium]|nr:hypothetical protein [Rhodothermales bacterium]
MYIVAQHEIADPKAFFEIAASSPIPEGFKLHQVFPSGDGSRCTCLWEADSAEAVRSFVDGAAGHVSTNAYYAVADGNAVGLPRTTQAYEPA